LVDTKVSVVTPRFGTAGVATDLMGAALQRF
jgi:hypothetical protein